MPEPQETPLRPWWAITLPPRWLYPVLPVVLAGTGVWRAITGTGSAPGLFIRGALWPGSIIAAVVFVVAWLGWALDLE